MNVGREKKTNEEEEVRCHFNSRLQIIRSNKTITSSNTTDNNKRSETTQIEEQSFFCKFVCFDCRLASLQPSTNKKALLTLSDNKLQCL